MAKLTLRKTDKNGSAIYAIDGVRGSVYVSKGMLAGEPPAELEIAYEGFAAPGTARVVGPKNATPEQIEKVRLAAEKAAERAAKAQERAAKAAARAAKYKKPEGEPVSA